MYNSKAILMIRIPSRFKVRVVYNAGNVDFQERGCQKPLPPPQKLLSFEPPSLRISVALRGGGGMENYNSSLEPLPRSLVIALRSFTPMLHD